MRAKNFVASCLQKNVKKRRGREDGAAHGKLRKDWWFYGADWKKIARRTCEFRDVPFVPSLDRGSERVNFDEFVIEEDVARKLRPLEPEDVEELDLINDKEPISRNGRDVLAIIPFKGKDIEADGFSFLKK